MAADLLYKSVPGLCLIISRAAIYLPKPALNNILSLLCILQSLWMYHTVQLATVLDWQAPAVNFDRVRYLPKLTGYFLDLVSLVLYLVFKFFQFEYEVYLNEQKVQSRFPRAVVVAQLVERSLSNPEIHCSNPIMSKCLFLTVKKTIIKQRSPGIAHKTVH